MILRKIIVTLQVLWCMAFHHKYHICYWTQFSRHFFRCNLCNCRFSRPRS